MPIQKSLNKDFFKVWSPDMAYVLGFFAADGNMIKSKKGNHFISLEITDLKILLKIRELLGSDHKIYSRKNRPGWKKRFRIQIGSKKIFQDLLRLGITPKKSKTIEFPDVPTEFICHFVRGYFDGDGCVSFGRYWRKDRGKWKFQLTTRFTSESKKFLNGLWLALKPYVSGGHISEKKGAFELVFSQKDSVAIQKFMYHNTAAGMFLERKLKIFQGAFEKLRLRS